MNIPLKDPLHAVPTSDIGSSIESSLSPHATSQQQTTPPVKHVDDAVGKLDSLVYNKQGRRSVPSWNFTITMLLSFKHCTTYHYDMI